MLQLLIVCLVMLIITDRLKHRRPTHARRLLEVYNIKYSPHATASLSTE